MENEWRHRADKRRVVGKFYQWTILPGTRAMDTEAIFDGSVDVLKVLLNPHLRELNKYNCALVEIDPYEDEDQRRNRKRLRRGIILQHILGKLETVYQKQEVEKLHEHYSELFRAQCLRTGVVLSSGMRVVAGQCSESGS